MDYAKRLTEIETRKEEIRVMMEDEKAQIDLKSIKEELRSLTEEKKDIESRQEVAKMLQSNEIQARRLGGGQDDNSKLDENSEEFRSAFFKNLQGKELTEMEKRALTYTTSTAGAVIPTKTLNRIVEKLEQDSVLFPLVEHYNIPGNLTIGVEDESSECEWTKEGVSGTAKEGKIKPITLAAYQVCKFVSLSAQITKMSIDALENFIVNSLTRKLRRAVDKAILAGTGKDEPTGITNGMTFKTVSKLDYDTISDIDAELNSEYSKNAVYVMNKKTRNLVKKIKNEIGDPIYVKDASAGIGGVLDGYPLIIYDKMPDNKLILGDFSQYIFNFADNPAIDKSKDAGFYQNAEVYRIAALGDGKPVMQEAFVGVEVLPETTPSE